MYIIKFCVEGVFNSFRVPFFRTYHKSFLAPPKTTIIGMLTNIMGKSEKVYYELLNEDKIKVSVVINSIDGKVKDLWSYKTLENKSDMHGRSIVRRDRLYNARYTIYLKVDDDDLGKEIYGCLKYPKAVPALGLDDELVKIYNVQSGIELIDNDSFIINSVFMDKGYQYNVKLSDLDKEIELPTANVVPLKYNVEFNQDSRLARKGIEQYQQVEYMNCFVELKDVRSYICDENRIVFY